MKEANSIQVQLFPMFRRCFAVLWCGWFWSVALAGATFCALGDQVEMDNGDRYFGKIVSLNADTLILQNDVLGTVPLPRSRVSVMSLGTNAVVRPVAMPAASAASRSVAVPAANPAQLRPAPSTNDNWSALMRQLGSSTNAMREVQQQYLAGTTPETEAKFKTMLTDLASGKMSMNDLHREAQTAADQLRAFKNEMGDQTGMMDEYLSILDSFIAEVDASQPKTNAVRPGGVPRSNVRPSGR